MKKLFSVIMIIMLSGCKNTVSLTEPSNIVKSQNEVKNNTNIELTTTQSIISTSLPIILDNTSSKPTSPISSTTINVQLNLASSLPITGYNYLTTTGISPFYLANKKLYFFSDNSKKLWSMDLSTNAKKIVLSATLTDPDSLLYGLNFGNDDRYIIVYDSSRTNLGTSYLIDSKTDKILYKIQANKNHMQTIWLAANEDTLILEQLVFDPATNCAWSSLEKQSISTGQKQELDKICTLNDYMWFRSQINNNTLIVEQDYPTIKGGGNNVMKIDIRKNTKTLLTNDQISAMPIISDQYIVWKKAKRFETTTRFEAVSIRNNTRRIFDFGQNMLDPSYINSQWLTIKPEEYPSLIVFLYDLSSERVYKLTDPQNPKNSCGFAQVYGDLVVWNCWTESESNKQTQTFIYWAIIR